MEGKRYMAPEKKDVYVRFPDSHARQPFTPRHTPAYAFPPPGSDIRRHGAKDFIVNGSNFYNRNSSNQGKLQRYWFQLILFILYKIYKVF